MYRSRLLLGTWMLAVVLSVVSCGGGDDGGPGPSGCDPALSIVNGNGQSGEPSTELPVALEVRATTCDDTDPQGPQVPEADLGIVWAVTGGGGTVNGVTVDTVLTDAAGLAQAVWLLGPDEGTQSVSATALRGSPDVVGFTATATSSGCPANSVSHPGGVFTADETWGPGGHLVTGNVSFAGSATLTIAAGAQVCFDGGGIEITEQSHLAVRGSSADPVVFESVSFGGSLTFGVNINALTTPSTISNARFESVTIFSSGSFHPVVIESTLVRDAQVEFGAPGSRFSHSTIVRGRLNVHGFDGGPILIEATVRESGQEGIFLNGSGITLTGCEVTDCGTYGVLSGGDATTIQIHGCNFSGNGDAGIWNGDLGQLDASGNWWGDPAGPNGPNGDGVAGNVDFSGALLAPAVLGYRPPE